MTVNPALRLRQICLLARDLEWTSSVLSAAFDASVVFRDPRMAAGGILTNTHIRLGDSFLETVCPSDMAWQQSTTQTRLLERNGDCGYMAIVQVPDVAAASRSMEAQGSGTGIVSGSWNVCPGAPGLGLAGVESGPYILGESLPKNPDTVSGINVQFHPKDFGTLAEIQENWPGQVDFPNNKGTYHPAGNTWQNGVDARPHGGVTTGFAAVEIAPRGDDPEEVCQRWMNGLDAGCSIDPDEPTTLKLAYGQTMRFIEPGADGKTGVVGVDLWAAPGAYKRFESIEICGVNWTLVDHV
ncbi:MAG TPA: hypothetical protein DCM54_16865 [Gammaproteobacteria bacterium]|nr:hypothetical protein [Gammaproteobacteria bacterium]